MQGNNFHGYISLKTDNVPEIEESLHDIEKYSGKRIKPDNSYATIQAEKSAKKVTEFLVNSFVAFIALISAINIYNTIYSSMLIRKKDFLVLKSIRSKQ